MVVMSVFASIWAPKLDEVVGKREPPQRNLWMLTSLADTFSDTHSLSVLLFMYILYVYDMCICKYVYVCFNIHTYEIDLKKDG